MREIQITPFLTFFVLCASLPQCARLNYGVILEGPTNDDHFLSVSPAGKSSMQCSTKQSSHCLIVSPSFWPTFTSMLSAAIYWECNLAYNFTSLVVNGQERMRFFHLLFFFGWLMHETWFAEEKEASHTVFENHRKSLILHCERSELRLHFEWTKVN